jgi:5'-nucleotidase
MAGRRTLWIAVLAVATLSTGCGSGGGPGSQADAAGEAELVGDTSGEELARQEIPADAADDALRVTILHTNDLHSHLDGSGPLADYTPLTTGDDGTRGGFARLAAMIAAARAGARANEGVLALDAGDFTMGSGFSALSATLGPELNLLDRMGFAATTLGNHEFEWGPGSTAAFVGAARDATELKVLAANLVFDPADPADDSLAALVDDGTIQPYRVVTLPNGVKVGLFGLLGNGALTLAPEAKPVTIEKPATAAARMVKTLRETEQVDLVVCLSHGGLGEDGKTGEDEGLVKSAPGIDVIVSGHSHTLTLEPRKVDDTWLVQAGEYGQHLGRLTLVKGAGGWALEAYQALPVDDSVAGDAEVDAAVQAYEAQVAGALLQGTGVAYRDVVATTAFDVPSAVLAESALGDLVTDAIRWSATQHVPEAPVDVAIEANGVIREPLLQGATGKILVGDALQVLPLGTGPDHSMGYPILAFYVTAKELKNGMEVTTTAAPLISDVFYLQVSGLKVTYDPKRPAFDRVTAIHLAEGQGYAAQPLDTSDANPRLFRVAANLYIVQMMAVLTKMTGGKLSILPKDAQGKVLADPEQEAILDLDPATEGVQELKLWKTLLEFLAAQPQGQGGVPALPQAYAQPQGRWDAVQ